MIGMKWYESKLRGHGNYLIRADTLSASFNRTTLELKI